MPATKPTDKVKPIGPKSLREAALSIAGSKVDAANHVVRDVKIIGLVSGNNREYTREALAKAAHLYEGVRVNFNHSAKPGEPRNYEDRFGKLVNISLAADGLRGDLQYNPRHRLAEQFEWDAQHAPENLGLSHDSVGQTVMRGNKEIVESINRVRSVDIVADPATTSSLYESQQMDGETVTDTPATDAAPVAPASLKDGARQKYIDKVAALMQGDDFAAMGKAVMEQIKSMAKAMGVLAALDDEMPSDGPPETPVEAPAMESLREQLNAVQRELATTKRHAAVERELAAAGFADPKHKAFREHLLKIDDAATRKMLIEDRQQIVNRPMSGSSWSAGGDKPLTLQDLRS
jgi:hypothetical protein